VGVVHVHLEHPHMVVDHLGDLREGGREGGREGERGGGREGGGRVVLCPP